VVKNDLIDLMEEPTPTHAPTGSSNPVDELADIFGGPSTTTSNPAPNFFNNISQPQNGGGSSNIPSMAGGFIPGLGGITLPTTPHPPTQQQQQSPPQFPFQTSSASTLQPTSSPFGMGMGMGQQNSQQQQTRPFTQSPQSQPQPQNKDPFADLAGLF